MSEYETRLDNELQGILKTQRTAALGSLAADGSPFVSQVQYTLVPGTHRLLLQVSALAPHTAHMQADPRVSLLVLSSDPATDDAARARITLVGEARFPTPGSEEWQVCRLAWLARFPESENMASMLELSLVAIDVRQVRQVSGFGMARSLGGDALAPLLAA
jgi:hypothetical protein